MELDNLSLPTGAILGDAEPQNAPPSAHHSGRQTLIVLLSCCMLQLPIWGFAMTFGIFQEHFSHDASFHGSKASTAVIGTTTNGVMYLSMPILFVFLDSGRWSHLRRHVAITGVLLSSTAFLISSFGKQVWQLILLQGVLAALGSAMLYSPTTLFIDEWFVARRATAYGATLSSKNIVGTCCPFLMYGLLDKLGPWWTLRVWACITLFTGLAGIFMMPQHTQHAETTRARKIPWNFLKHRTFYIYAIGNAVQSAGYGIPQIYLSEYSSDVLHFSAAKSSLMLALFNVPGILSCLGFGYLADKAPFSASTNTFISAFGSGMCALLLWGTKANSVPAVLVLFSVGYGFFAGGYSSTWGGWVKEMELEARETNEAIHTGMVYGLFNGARGVGYVFTGPSGVALLNLGAVSQSERWGYGTRYGALIIFTGICSVLGGWSIMWRSGKPCRP